MNTTCPLCVPEASCSAKTGCRVWVRVIQQHFLFVLLRDKAGATVDSIPCPVPPEHRRAVGAAVKQLAAAGVIEPVGRAAGSRRRVWRVSDPGAARRWAAEHPLLPNIHNTEERNRPCENL